MIRSARLEGAPQVERFEIREKIGEGAMGLVFRALDREIGRDVAIKTLRRRAPGDLRTLKAEFRALTDIRHRNLVEMMELFADGESCFITMEWIDGSEFGDFARPRSDGPDSDRVRAPLASILVVVHQLLCGLDRLHASGKLHQDVKPSNVMVDRFGRAVLLDFGLVGAFNLERPAWSQARPVAGTFDYMPPEQAWGRGSSPASDLYALGAVLYEALTGRLPYSGAQLAAMLSGRAEAPVSPDQLDPSLPEDLCALTMELLSLDPERRPTTTEALARLDSAGVSDVPRARRTAVDEARLAPAPAARSPFLGRTREIGQLRKAFERTASGEAGVLRVVGVSGIGKSRLVDHFLTELERDAPTETRPLVLRARCLPEESVRFKAVDGLVDDLSRFLAARPDDVKAPLDVSALTRVFPVLRDASLPADPDSPSIEGAEPHVVRTRAFQSLRALLRLLSRQRPLVLWIDDLQWGDVDSIPLLAELVRAPGAPQILLILSYRGGQRGPVLDAVEDEQGDWARSETLALGPLRPSEGQALVDALLGDGHPELVGPAHRIPDEAGGSPFFIGELSRMLLHGGPPAEGLSVQPPLIADVVDRRVQGLEARARRLLEVVAVAGAPIDRSLALRAADLSEADRRLFKDLRVESLVRAGGGEEASEVEPYHDQIREKVIASFDADRLASLHATLLEVYEAEAALPPERLLVHAYGSGRLDAAARYAEQAGDQATESLAFLQAARFYEEALAWAGVPDSQRPDLHVRCAEALVNAGRGLDAAEHFVSAAHFGSRAQALDWRARAAEQFLVSGRIERGLELLEPLLDEYGVAFPRTEARAIVATLGGVARLALRGTRFKRRSESEIDARDLARIDLCHSASKGLVSIDPARGGYLALCSLLLALRAGEPHRVGRGLAVVGGAVLVPAGGPLLRWGRRMLARTAELAQELGDDYLRGIVDMTRGQIAVFVGDWRTAVELGNRAIETLTLRCRGVTWEANTGHQAALRGLEELGRYDQLSFRSSLHRARSAERGDVYGEMISSSYLAVALIADGQTRRARAQHRAAYRRWTHGRFDVQSLYVLRADIMCDIYEGLAMRGWRKLEEAWPEIEKAMLLRVPVTRIDSILLRARLAVLCAAGSDGDATQFLRSAERDAKRLEREGRVDTSAHAAAIRAAIARLEGDEAAVRSHVQRAEEMYEREGMVALAICMRVARKGGFEDEEIGQLTRCGVRDPKAWLDVMAPGFSAPAGRASQVSPVSRG